MVTSVIRASVRTARTAFLIFTVGTALAVCLGTLPSLLGFDSFVISGGSMSPAIPPGAIVVADRVPVESLRAGDIVTFRPNAAARLMVTHRVETVKPEPVIGGVTVRTRGDGNAKADPVDTQLTGAVSRLVFFVPLAGYLVDATRTRVGAPLAILVPLLGMFLTYLKPPGTRTARGPADGVDRADGVDADLPPEIVSLEAYRGLRQAAPDAACEVVAADARRGALVIENRSSVAGYVTPAVAPAMAILVAASGWIVLDQSEDRALIQSAWMAADPSLEWAASDPLVHLREVA